MKELMTLAVIAVFCAVAGAGPAPAQEAECPHHEATIDSLRMCVEHAFEMGHIDSHGIAASLLAKLDAAQAAYDRGEPWVAVNMVEAFVQETEAQAGKHIEADHAGHMIMHAEMVLAALST